MGWDGMGWDRGIGRGTGGEGSTGVGMGRDMRPG